jgi:threonine dehydrogenase-like Zn-dependent dehydrogenase
VKAYVARGVNDMRLEEVAYPELRPGWVIAKVRTVEPSVGDVSLVGGGDVQSYYQSIIPVILGHEFTAGVVEMGPGVTKVEKGDRIVAIGSIACGECASCKAGRPEKCKKPGDIASTYPGAFAEYIAVPQDIVEVLPQKLSDSEGALIQPLENSIDSVRSAEIKMGDTVAVIGQGVMGLCCMQVARVSGGGRIITIAPRAQNLQVSASLGADETINSTEQDPVKEMLRLTNGEGADVVFETAGGTPKFGLAGKTALDQAVKMVRKGGKIVQVASIDEFINFNLFEFLGRSVKYIFPEWPRMVREAIAYVASGKVQLKPLVTHELRGLTEIPRAFEILANKPKFNAIQAQVIVSS